MYVSLQDWGDLWRPELAGKISMVDSPREVIGAVLKHMGASYNTKDIDTHVPGGKEAVMQYLAMLQKQVHWDTCFVVILHLSFMTVVYAMLKCLKWSFNN